MGEYCYFQAGVAGQRAGVTVVTLGDNGHIRTPETVRTLAVHVLPKIWSPNGRRNIIEPLPADRPHPTHLLDETGCLHVYLYEREILKLPRRLAAALQCRRRLRQRTRRKQPPGRHPLR